MSDTILLIDGFGYLYRAFYAMGDFRSGDKPTGAIFGTLNMIDKLRRKYPTQRVVCVMDAGGKNFRSDIDPQYKANRPPLPPDLKVQITPFSHFIRALGMPILAIEGVEADDIIATLAQQGVAAGIKTIIASADKDLMQLVDGDNIVLYDGSKERLYDINGVHEKFGVYPTQIADYLALVGDTADNIPGVVKVGAKTAAKWLNTYGSLDAIIAAAADIGGVVGNNLREAISSGRLALSRRLVALDDKTPLPLQLDALTLTPPDVMEWKKLCEESGFQRLRTMLDDQPVSNTLFPPPTNAADDNASTADCINDLQTLEKWVAKIRTAGIVAVDTETVGEPTMAAQMVGFSLAVGEDSAYVPVAHTATATPPQIPRDDALRVIKPILEDATIVKVLHNGKYDWHVFANVGVMLAGVLEDTKIAAYVADAGSNNTLSGLSTAYLNRQMIEYKDVVDGKQIKNFAEVDIANAVAYAAEDADVTLRLYHKLITTLPADKAQIYTTLDRPLMPVLAGIERVGMRINTTALNDFTETAREKMETVKTRANDIAGEPFNINSPRQLEGILFDKLGAQPLHKTGGGARSTDERTLEKLSPHHELAAVVLEHRTLAKLVGTYAEKLPLLVNPQTGRIHTTFTQTAVVTGRLSSSSPNLQNIPIRTEAGRLIRRAFIAEDGYCLLSADYSQIELRIMAHIAKDEALCQAFIAGSDIHQQTAAEVFGLPLSDVTAEQRRAAKVINFGLIYGMSSYGLARNINIPQEQAQLYIRRYFTRYPSVAEFMQRTRKTAPDLGYVETIIGRRIPLGTARGGRPALERFAINAPIQGSAADLVKKAMLNVDAQLRIHNLRSHIVLQVHDELVLEVALDEADFITAKIEDWMNVADLLVPLQVNAQCGDNWDDAH